MKHAMKSLVLLFGALLLAHVASAEPLNSPRKQSGAQVSIPPGYPITEVQLRKVLMDLARTGTELSLNAIFVKPLGLGKNGGKVQMRQLAVKDDNAVLYGFALLKDGSGYIVDMGPRSGNTFAFRLDENLKMVASVAVNDANETISLSPTDAEARLSEVLATWAEYADTLQAE